MKVLVCSDKFKGSLSAHKVCTAIVQGLQLGGSGFDCAVLPLADGGDGTGVILKSALQLKEIKTQSVDPLGRPIVAAYYCNKDTAYIELAEASGMWRLEKDELDVMSTTTIGTGLLIKNAIEQGFRKVVLCLGGSCTNDVGLGIAHAMGFSFLDDRGEPVVPCGGKLLSINKVVPPVSQETFELRILCDVTNPLYGVNGAAHIYARQKGADDQQIALLDNGMRQLAELIATYNGRQIGALSGAGAAGGVAAGLFGLLDKVVIENGFDYLASVLGLSKRIQNSELVISGEGRLDSQSFQGKVIGKVAALCRQSRIPLAVIVGQCDMSDTALKAASIMACSTVSSIAKSESDAMAKAEEYIVQLSKDLGTRLLQSTL